MWRQGGMLNSWSEHPFSYSIAIFSNVLSWLRLSGDIRIRGQQLNCEMTNLFILSTAIAVLKEIEQKGFGNAKLLHVFSEHRLKNQPFDSSLIRKSQFELGESPDQSNSWNCGHMMWSRAGWSSAKTVQSSSAQVGGIVLRLMVPWLVTFGLEIERVSYSWLK